MATTDVWADGSEWAWVDDAGVSGGGYWKNTKPSNDGQYAGRYWYDGAVRLSKPEAVSATKASQWTGQGPNGYGTYLLDGPGGTAGTWVGDPSKPSSGGTTVINTNSTSAWSRITDPVTGDIYNYNEITGEKQLLFPGNKSAGTAGDANGDGYDDSTGLPNGVKSIGGKLYYQGVRVNPDGSPYTGSDAPDLDNGKYMWDPVAKKYVIAPGMESTSSSSSSANISVRTPASSYSSSSGGGGSGGTSIADQLALIEAKSGANMSESQQDYELKRELMLLQFALDNDPNNPELLLRKQQLAMQIEDAVGQRAKDYATAVSAVDPLAFAAIYQAHGGNVGNLLASGEDAISPRSLAAAAAIFNSIGQMRDRLTGLGSGASGGTYGGGLGVQPGVGTGVQPGISPGTGTGTGVATGGGTGTGAGTGTQADPPAQTQEELAVIRALKAEEQRRVVAEQERQAFYNVANWQLVPGNVTYGGGGTSDRYVNTVTGDRMTAQEYAISIIAAQQQPQVESEANLMMEALQNAEILAGQTPGAALDPWAREALPQGTASGTGGTILYNMPWGWSPTNQVASTSWQTGGDRGDLSRVITTDVGTPVAGAGGPILAQEPVNPNQTVMGPVAAYAEGTMAKPRGFGRNMAMLPSRSRGLAMPRALPPVPMRGEHLATDMHIVGDPKPGTNRPNPELVQWTPRGNRIIPAADADLMRVAVPATPRYPAGMMSRPRGLGIPAYARGTTTTTTRTAAPAPTYYPADGMIEDGGVVWDSLYTDPVAPAALATPPPVVTAPAPVVSVPPAVTVTAPEPVANVPAPIATAPAPVVTAPAPVVTSAPADPGAGTVVSTATTPSQSATSPAAVSPSPTAPAPVATTPAPTTTTALATADTTNPTTLPATAATPTVITISPEDQATMDMIRDLREGAYATRPDVSLYQSDYFNLDPTVRAVYEASLQAGKGIPVASSQFEAEKYRPRGFSRSQFALGV